MALAAATGRIHMAMKTLLVRWEDTRGRWNDPVGRAFEEQYVEPLEKQIRTSLRALDRLAQELYACRRDCS
jgi:hypothetical protein